MTRWTWVPAPVAIAIHGEQIAEHGGGGGIRDQALLESALARPRNVADYEKPDVARLAASYAFGIAKNHPFVDGNKRVATVVMEFFLHLNGYDLRATDEDIVKTILALADGSLDEASLADWVRNNLDEL